MWNWGFVASQFALAQADQLWGTDANHDGKIDSSDPKEHVGQGWMWFYGYRSAQIATIARKVFASRPGCLRTVISTQTSWAGLEGYAFEGVARANLGTVGSLFDEYSVTTYFDGMLRGAGDKDRATILGWAKAGDVAPALQALRDATGLCADAGVTDQGSLKYLAGLLAYHEGVAKQNVLTLVSYEGGLDLSSAGGTPYGADAALVNAYIAKVKASDGMHDVYADLFAKFEAARGALLNIYLDFDGGAYGTVPSVYAPDTPAWKAMIEHNAAQPAAPVSAPVVAPVATPAPIATPVVPVVESPAGPVIFAAVFGNTLTGQGGAAMVQGAFTTIGFDRVVVDSHGGFDLATGIYTVAEDGFYDLSLDNFRIADGNIDGLSYGVGVDLVGRDSPAFRWARGATLRQSAGCFVGLKSLKKGDQLRAFYYLDGAPTTYIAARWSVRRIA